MVRLLGRLGQPILIILSVSPRLDTLRSSQCFNLCPKEHSSHQLLKSVKFVTHSLASFLVFPLKSHCLFVWLDHLFVVEVFETWGSGVAPILSPPPPTDY